MKNSLLATKMGFHYNGIIISPVSFLAHLWRYLALLTLHFLFSTSAVIIIIVLPQFV